MTMLAGDDEITELEKISPSRVDGVDLPASGFPILLMKAVAGTAPKEPTETAKAVAPVPDAETPETQAETAPQDAPAPPAAEAPQEAAKSAADPGTVTVDLPADIRLDVSPAVLARMATLKQKLVLEQAAMKAAAKASPSAWSENSDFTKYSLAPRRCASSRSLVREELIKNLAQCIFRALEDWRAKDAWTDPKMPGPVRRSTRDAGL